MDYRLRYFADYKDLSDNDIRLEIYMDSEGEDEELILSSPAITIDYQAEDIFQPLKKSGASINILTENVKEDLFTGKLLSPQVRIYKNTELFWFGYITPNIYTQPYKDVLDLMTLECIDSISQLNNLDFKTVGSITSFMDLITRLLDAVDTEKIASKIYIPTSIALDNDSDILSKLYIQERNFYDEADESEKADTVIGSIMQYLGFTMMQYKDAYYIVDYDALSTGNYNFLVYDRTTGTKTTETLDLQIRNVSSIGIANAKGTVNLDGVYNKVTVIANNNPLNTVLPKFDDDEDIINQNEDPDCSYEENYSSNDVNYVLVSGFFKSKADWNYTIPMVDGSQIDEVTLSNRDSIDYGIFWQKVDHYDSADGEPSSLSWNTFITMTSNTWAVPTLTLNNTKPIILDGGYLIVNLKYKFSTDIRAHDVIRSMYDSAGTYGSCTDLTWTSDSRNIGYDNWPDNTMFGCKMTVGNYYYNGEEWIDYATFNAKKARGYYSLGTDNINGYAPHGGPGSVHKQDDWENWYRIQNSYGDWIYVTSDVYNSNSGTKETGKTKNNNHFWYVNGDGVSVQMCIDYYYELMLEDKFYLVHKNKVTEKIYDTEYYLTNTVSYKMKIVDSSDGVAIKCPTDKVLFGNLTFELTPPSKLGSNPQWRSDMPTTTLKAVHISDLTMKYSKTDPKQSIYGGESADPDVTYTNVINEDYCQEMDDIELMVNTCSDCATSYSYVIGLNGSDYYYVRNGLEYLDGTTKKPEEKLVERYVDYYSSPKYKYGDILENDDITPFSLIRETNLGKVMMVNKATYDLSNDCVEIESNQL